MFSYLLLSVLGCFIQLIMIRSTNVKEGIRVRMGKGCKRNLKNFFPGVTSCLSEQRTASV